MKASKADVLKLAKSLKDDFKRGIYKGSYVEALERIVLGFENAFRAGDGNIGIESRGRYYYLYVDLKV